MCSLFHNAYSVRVTRNLIRKGVQVKKIGSQIEVKGLAKDQGEGNGQGPGPARIPGTVTIDKIPLHSLY